MHQHVIDYWNHRLELDGLGLDLREVQPCAMSSEESDLDVTWSEPLDTVGLGWIGGRVDVAIPSTLTRPSILHAVGATARWRDRAAAGRKVQQGMEREARRSFLTTLKRLSPDTYARYYTKDGKPRSTRKGKGSRSGNLPGF